MTAEERQRHIEAINEYFEKATKAPKEAMESMMTHCYVDCIDDYSIYGPGWQSYENEVTRAKGYRDLMLKALDNDGWLEKETRKSALYDLDGNKLNAHRITSKFGACWMIHPDNEDAAPKFVSMASRQATYAKKGYRMVCETTHYKAHVEEYPGSICWKVTGVTVEDDTEYHW